MKEVLNVGRFTNVERAYIESDCVIFDFDEGLPQDVLEASLDRLEASAHAQGWEVDQEMNGKCIKITINTKNFNDFTAEIGIQVKSTDGKKMDFEFIENVITKEEGLILARITRAYIDANNEAKRIRRERRQLRAAQAAKIA